MKTFEDCIKEVQEEMGDSYMLQAITVRNKAAELYRFYLTNDVIDNICKLPGTETQYGKMISIDAIIAVKELINYKS